jgi:hypothetical protein
MLQLNRIALILYKIILRSLFLNKIVTGNCILSEENDLLERDALHGVDI